MEHRTKARTNKAPAGGEHESSAWRRGRSKGYEASEARFTLNAVGVFPLLSLFSVAGVRYRCSLNVTRAYIARAGGTCELAALLPKSMQIDQ